MVHSRLILFLLVCSFSQAQKIDRFTRFAGDPIADLTPDFYANTTSIVSADNNEGTEITEWSNLANATPDAVAGVTPEVHVGTAGAAVQVSFVEGNGDYLNTGQTHQYDPSSSKPAYFIIRVGDAIDNTGTVLSQAVSTLGSRAFQIYASSSLWQVLLGGNINATTVAPSANQLIIVNVSSTNYDVWIDGVEEISNSTNIGTGNSAHDINIGSRTNGSLQWNGDIDIVAYEFGQTLTQGEIDAIFAKYQVN